MTLTSLFLAAPGAETWEEDRGGQDVLQRILISAGS